MKKKKTYLGILIKVYTWTWSGNPMCIGIRLYSPHVQFLFFYYYYKIINLKYYKYIKFLNQLRIYFRYYFIKYHSNFILFSNKYINIFIILARFSYTHHCFFLNL